MTEQSYMGQGVKVTPYDRIEDLQDFYSRGTNATSNVIEADLKKKMSEEARGQWVTEQLTSAAKAMAVEQFVIPLDRGSAREIPAIPALDEYVEAYINLNAESMDKRKDKMKLKEEYAGMCQKRLEVYRRRTERRQSPERQEDGLGGEMEAREADSDDNADVKIAHDDERAMREYSKLFKEWEQQEASLQNEQRTIEEWIADCRQKASKQYASDRDAMACLLNTLAALKKFLQNLIKKVPEVEDIVHTKRDDGLDPFEENDMRQCLGNLLSRYRKDDELGILTTVIQGMGEKQGSKPLSAHIRNCEDFLKNMIRLRLEFLPVDDLVAMVAIAGMQETTRTEFIHQFDMYNKAFQHMESEVDDNSTTRSSKPKKSLFTKVREFARQHDDTSLINQKLRGTKEYSNVTTSSSDSQVQSPQEAKRIMIEAQQAFAALSTDRVPEEVKNKSVCFQFEKTGKCRNGDKCRFLHPTQAQGKRECWQFKKGTCTYGAACKFAHVGAAEANSIQITQIPKQDKKRASVLFDFDDDSESNQDKEMTGTGYCVLVKSRASKSEAVHSVATPQISCSLGWDTMASVHVANSLDVIPGACKIKSQRNAIGLGGIRSMTHQGMSPVFGIDMVYIEGGGTPNLLSIGQSLQKDEHGRTGFALFTHKGAIKMRKNAEIEAALDAIVNRAEELDLVEGIAKMVDGVYTQQFGNPVECQRKSTDDSAHAVTSLYASRVPFSTESQVIGMLVSAGVSQKALVDGVKNQSIKGLPAGVTEQQINKYFRDTGLDADMLSAKITTLPLRDPIDYNKMVTNTPGEIMYLDNIDPSFSRMKGNAAAVNAIGGYKDAVLVVDGATGYAEVLGRTSKRDPHKVVQLFLRKWIANWNTLKVIKSDKEFVTKDSQRLCELHLPKVRLSMAVPYDHRRGLDLGEGTNRWIQDQAQGHMNHAAHWVKEGVITEVQLRSLWFHAMTLAQVVNNMKLSNCINSIITRYEEAHHTPFNLSETVILPFATPTISRKGEGDNNGRGEMGLYLGPSAVVRGGILTITLSTWRIKQVYSFAARDRLPSWFDVDVAHAAGSLYGELRMRSDDDIVYDEGTIPELDESTQDDDIYPDNVEVDEEGAESRNAAESQCGQEVTAEEEDVCHAEMEENEEDNTSTEAEKVIDTDKESHSSASQIEEKSSTKQDVVPVIGTGQNKAHHYYTRSRQSIKAYAVTERPPKPTAPSRRMAVKKEEWNKASEREQQKLIDEEVFLPLFYASSGDPILPDNPVFIPLMDLFEYKWKLDPHSNQERWLECVRIVGNGAHDDRKGEKTYAETPDRSVLFYMMSVGATLGETAMTGDAIRAYLNALSLDRNIVIRAPPHMRLLPRLSLLNKGLYGTIKGALSFQVWADDKFVNEMKYRKCDVARGVYIKQDDDMNVTRVFRHSDDFRVSSTNSGMLNREVSYIQEHIRTNGFEPESRFLGITIERLDIHTGIENPKGQLLIVRMDDNINKMWKQYGYLAAIYNPSGKIRGAPLPTNALKEDLTDRQAILLNEQECKIYMGLNGQIGWITSQVRVDSRFAYWVLSRKMGKARQWDMYLAVFCMEYLYTTIELPLILGGPVADPEVLCDASFGILEERRSVKAHMARTGPDSGVIMSACGSIKNTIKSIFEAELMATSDGIDTEMYMDHLGTDLMYDVQRSNKVKSDNEAALNWIEGSVPTKSSRHVEVRLYNARHLSEEGDVNLEHVRTEDNIADILTKPLDVKTFCILRFMVMGHALVKGITVRGVK
jgi:hypothetical protein